MPSQSILIPPPSSSAQITDYPNMTNSPAPPPLPPHLRPTYFSHPPSNPTPLVPTPYPYAPAKTSIRRRSLLTVGCIGAAVLGCGALGYGPLSFILRPATDPPTSPTNASLPPSNTPTPDSGTPTLLHTSTIYTGGSTSLVSSVGWSPDGKMLASGDVVGKINIWSVKPSYNTPVTSYQYPPSSNVNVITWSPDGQSIAAGYGDNTIQIWNMTSQSPVISYASHTDPVYNLAWSSQQSLIASVSSISLAYDIHIWDATTGKFLNKCSLPLPEPNVSSLAWSHNSSLLRLAISATDGSVFIWKQKERQFLRKDDPFKINAPITAVAWNEDDSELLVAAGAGVLYDSEKRVYTLTPGAPSGVTSFKSSHYPDVIYAVCWKAGVIYAACANGTLRIEPVSRTYQIPMDNRVAQYQNAWAWSPDGKYLAYGMNDGSVMVWQVP